MPNVVRIETDNIGVFVQRLVQLFEQGFTCFHGEYDPHTKIIRVHIWRPRKPKPRRKKP